MKRILTLMMILLTIHAWSQKEIDTVKVYNVYCSYAEGNSYTTWGGNWTEFYPAEACPDSLKQKYIDNHIANSKYLNENIFFWIKLYNTNEELIYEGLKYGDCRIGKFICYWPNGKIKLTGEYNGYSYSTKTGYKIKKCAGKKKGDWIYYDENEKQEKLIKY